MWRLEHVETDAVDRAAFARLSAPGCALAELCDEGARLLPHFRALLFDLFASLYKLQRVRFPAPEMRPSVRVHASILDAFEASGALAQLRARTELDAVAAGLATGWLGDRVLRWLRRARPFTGSELVDGFRSAEAEAERDAEAAAEAEARRLAGAAASQQGRDALLAEAERRAQRRAALERKLADAGEAAERAVASVPREARTRLDRDLARAPEALADLELELEDWELHVEGRESDAAARRIELGRALARNPKLVRLAALVGRFREHARALRRAHTPRRSAEVYAVGTGDDPGRLLPAELVKLRHPLARRDLLRRLLDGAAQTYALRGPERSGHGPMLVCLDCSSSMEGAKELWSKAAALTLLHVARRRRRPFEVLAFSGAEAPIVHFPLVVRGGAAPDARGLVALAEHFPGGGTSFEKALSAALERVRGPRAAQRKADVVLISDGESSLSEAFGERLAAARRRDEVALWSVLIDVGSHSEEAMRRFSDRVVRVRELTAEAAGEIALALDQS